ncbi:hypothetical protein [Gemmobacter serpentinus]|uniref:hypothetical protein n=1 Tax=Gemmobacter serpentinus TaxID=2652247 RepID=UPI00124D8DD7|nr:hypothetical protein [Gemmobacter serpentinus]
MLKAAQMAGLVTASAVLVACAAGNDKGAPAAARYEGIETILLDGEMVNFRVSMRNARAKTDVEAYARCAAAQYALIRGFGFARHVRTTVAQNGNQWRGDAVYVISASLPEGIRTIDAEVTVRDCASLGIPTI